MNKPLVKSIGAIVAGFLTALVLSFSTDILLQLTGIFPPFSEPARFTSGMLAFATAYRTVYNVAGCSLAARYAPSRPMLHAMILGSIGFVVSILGAIAGRGLGQAWYPIALVVLALPSAWLGGRLSIRAATEPTSTETA